MSEELSMLLKRAIEDELYASEAFIKLAGHESLPLDVIYHFLTYSQQESEHAKLLLEVAEQHQITIHLEKIKGPVIEDVLSFIVEYRAHEESGIFYYDTLLSYELDEDIKIIIEKIRDEEKKHYDFLGYLLEKNRK